MKHPFVKSLLVTLAVLFSVFFLAPPIQAQAPGADGSQDNLQTDGAAENPADDGVTCSIEKIGWILCPIIEGAAFIGDNAFSVLAGNFLEIEPALVANDENGTRGVWEIFRNIANIMFIIAFMVIIYSQITGAGLSNYGIKKMLPRVIFAAILVNISYYICQGMVDISNAGGYIIKDMLTDLAGQISNRAAMPIGGVSGAFAEGGTLSAIAVGALALGGAVYLLLPILMPVVGLVVITAFVIVVILLLRKAIVIMLVVLSPIAFVAYLLPNTEKFFSKWLHMFWQLLMVFPVVGLLFGAGQLTSAVVLAAGSNGGATSTYATEGEQCVTLPLVDQSNAASDPTAGASTGPCGEGSTTMTLGLVAAGIAIAPLLAVWSVLQGALSAAGAIGGKMAGVVSKFGDSRKKGRMDDIAKRRERISNERQANALNNKWSGANITSFGSNRRAARRNARGKQASTGLEAAEAGFNLSDDKASAFTQQAAVNKAAASAANIANNASLGQNISANNGGDILNALGKENQGNAAVNSAIAAQVSRATAEAVKDAELNLSGESVENLGVKLEAAIKEGKTIEAQAAQNKLFSSGSSGLKEYRSRMTGLTEPGGGANASTLQSVNNNLAMNHGAIKSTAADLMSHATSPAGTSLSSVSGNSSTWNMSDADLVGQKDHSIGLAVSAGGISVEQAQRILSNPQLAKELNDKSRTVLSSINGPYRPTAP